MVRAPAVSSRRGRSAGVALLAFFVGTYLWPSLESDQLVAFSTPSTWSPRSTSRQGGSVLASYDAEAEVRAPSVTMFHSGEFQQKAVYDDGWRYGGKNEWLEDALGGDWLNPNALRQYTFPSGRLKPRVMTKLRMCDHKRAIRYIKRLRQFGLMPFHRLAAKVETDPEARRPQVTRSPAGNQPLSRTALKGAMDAVEKS